MRKFTESLQHFSRELIDEISRDFAEELMIKYTSYLSVQEDFDMRKIQEVDPNFFFVSKETLYLTCEFTKLKQMYRIDDEGLRVHAENFEYFKKVVDELEILLSALESKVEYEVNFNFDKMITIHFEKVVDWQDYYEIFISILSEYVNSETFTPDGNKCEVKKISNIWVIDFDIEADIKEINDRRSDPIERYFQPNEQEQPALYKEYMKNPMTAEEWENSSNEEKQEAWLYRFIHRVYGDMEYDRLETLSPYKFRLHNPTDPSLEKYLPNNI